MLLPSHSVMPLAEKTVFSRATCTGRAHRMVPERKGGQPMHGTETTAPPAQARRILLELLENVIAAQFEEEAAEIVGTD